MDKTEQASASDDTTLSGCLVRLLWMVLGPCALIMLGFKIAEQAWWPFTWHDAAYWAVVSALAVVRLIDIRWLEGRTANGVPAGAAHLRRYLVKLVVAAGGLWVIAHLVARAGLMS